MFAALMLALLIDPQGRAVAPPPATQEVPRTAPPAELRVVLATPVYEPDGNVAVETTMLENGAPSILYLFARKSVCEIAKSTTSEPKDAWVGWRVTANTVSHSATEMVVSVDWRRMWDRGKKASDGPAATQQLVLHPGDSIPLDHIPNLQASSSCRAVGLGLEVRTAKVMLVPGGTVLRTGPDALPLGATPGGGTALLADLWLVHKKPSGVPEVVHQSVPLSLTGGPFAFSTVKFSTAAGEIGVEITGSIRRFQTPTNGEYMSLSMQRVITGGAAPTSGLTQGTSSTMPLPDPSQVYDFDMSSGAAGGRARLGGGGVGGTGSTEQLRIAVGGGGVGTRTTGAPTTQAGGTGGTGGGGAGSGGVIAGVAPAQRGGGGGGRGGAGGGRGSAAAGPATASQRAAMIALATTILDGHDFSLRIQLSPVK